HSSINSAQLSIAPATRPMHETLQNVSISSNTNRFASRVAAPLQSVSMRETQAHTRLKQRRIQCGYATAKAFAEANGFSEFTYRAHESGARGLKASTARRYAKALSVSWSWLMGADAEPPPAPAAPSADDVERRETLLIKAIEAGLQARGAKLSPTE